LRTEVSRSESLEYRLPLLIGGLLVAVIVALVTIAVVEVRNRALQTAEQRLTAVAIQFRESFQTSAAQLRAPTYAAAGAPDIATYARSRSARDTARALAALQYTGPQPQQILATELRDSAGAVLLSTAPPGLGLDTIMPSEVIRGAAAADSGFIGRFRVRHDTLIVPIAARVRGSDNLFVTRWRRVTGSRRSREQLRHLVGQEASLYLGNADGAGWTDMESIVPRPRLKKVAEGTVQSYRRETDHAEVLAAAMRVPGTPWMVVAAFPRDIILAPVEGFIRRMLLIAAIALILGLAAAAIASRRITTPLRDLTDAAVAISAGDYSRRVRVKRSDELGQLAGAFTTMAEEVQHHRENLETKIAERTSDLNDALRQLQDTQEALVRRERLAMLGQLSSGVGHELRNPLGVMTNAVYYLKAVLATAPDNVREYLDILQQQITLSEKIVGDLLDFARSKPPQRKATPVREATERQVEKLGRREGVRIDIAVSDSLPPVLVDPIQFGQIVFNLLTNASQAMDGSGRVTIRAEANSTAMTYEVSDTGPGIPKANLEKVFEPLFTTKARGIGLGLSVSRMLARANGGDLTVTSTEGHGATFRLTLPLAS
jgi:signal transduction histidine kinase